MAFETVSKNFTAFQNWYGPINSEFTLDRSGGVELTAASTLHLDLLKKIPKKFVIYLST